MIISMFGGFELENRKRTFNLLSCHIKLGDPFSVAGENHQYYDNLEQYQDYLLLITFYLIQYSQFS